MTRRKEREGVEQVDSRHARWWVGK